MPRMISETHAITALCLWEAMIDIEYARKQDTATIPWSGMRERHGTAGLREYMLDLAPACDEAWFKMSEEDRDCTAFDWEFVPAWIEHNVDWSGACPRPLT